MFGISGLEFVVLAAVAAVVLGPERLPQYAAQLARLIRQLRSMAQGATEQVRSEMGPEFDDIDWRKLDPRQYDPRRIVREALSESFDPDDPLGMKQNSPGGPASHTPNRSGAHPGTLQDDVQRLEQEARLAEARARAARAAAEAAPGYDPDAT